MGNRHFVKCFLNFKKRKEKNRKQQLMVIIRLSKKGMVEERKWSWVGLETWMSDEENGKGLLSKPSEYLNIKLVI